MVTKRPQHRPTVRSSSCFTPDPSATAPGAKSCRRAAETSTKFHPRVLCLAGFWTVFCICYSRFVRWAVLGGSGAASSGHFRPILGVRGVRAGTHICLTSSKRRSRLGSVSPRSLGIVLAEAGRRVCLIVRIDSARRRKVMLGLSWSLELLWMTKPDDVPYWC